MSAIYSRFAGDDDWQELLDGFIDELPLRLSALDTAIANEDQATLLTLLHQLKGACGSYGFDAITPLARDLESVVHAGADPLSWRSDLTNFRDALQRLTNQPAPRI